MTWVCIAVRIVANPFSNVFQKQLTRQSADSLWVVATTHGLLSLACVPALYFVRMPPSDAFWLKITFCSALAVVANTLLVQALKLSDLSLLGPINAWKPVVGLVPAMLVLRETPGWMGASGIALVIAGNYAIIAREPGNPARI